MQIEEIGKVAVSDAMTHEEVVSLLEDLLDIGADSDLEVEIKKQPKIFAVLERLYSVHSRKLAILHTQRAKVERLRTMFYDGKLPASHYQKEPLAVAVLKSDIPKLLDTDVQMTEMRALYNEQDRLVKSIERAKEQLRSRTWDLKNIIEYRKLLLGA